MNKLKSTCPSQLAPADVISALAIPSDIVKLVAEVTIGQATNPLWYVGVLFFFYCQMYKPRYFSMHCGIFVSLIQFGTCFL